MYTSETILYPILSSHDLFSRSTQEGTDRLGETQTMGGVRGGEGVTYEAVSSARLTSGRSAKDR